MQTRGWSVCVAVVLLAAGWASGQVASSKFDLQGLRESAGPAVCRITVENTWGIPQAVVSGFLLGEGRFVVTDLGAVAHPGVDRARLLFSDGTEAEATQFGLADPALGLAALRVDAKEPARRGLSLAPSLPPLDGVAPVGVIGWPWGKQLEAATGRVRQGPAIREVASRSNLQTPEGIDAFLRIEGARLSAVSGSPVVDRSGTVLAVRLDVAAPGLVLTLAMPAVSLRQSLLSSEPKLKPLSDLPRPLWPVDILRLPGAPPAPAEFLRTTQTVKTAIACGRCKGTGKVKTGWDLFDRSDVRCEACQGTGIVIHAEDFDTLTPWAEEGARAVWSAGQDGRSRAAFRTMGAEVLKSLAVVGRNFQSLFGSKGADLVKFPPAMPHGIVLYCRVAESVDGPDGRYLVLESANTPTLAAVRVDDLVGHDDMGPTAGRSEPGVGTWFALAGAVLSRFDTGQDSGVFVLPFEWAPYQPVAAEPGRQGGPRRDVGGGGGGQHGDGGGRGGGGGGGRGR
jgi:hypothetical protein